MTILVGVALYFVGASLGLIPEPVKDFASWLDRNTDILLISMLVLVVCFTILKLKRRKGEESS